MLRFRNITPGLLSGNASIDARSFSTAAPGVVSATDQLVSQCKSVPVVVGVAGTADRVMQVRDVEEADMVRKVRLLEQT